MNPVDFVKFFLENQDASQEQFERAYHQSIFKQQYLTPYRRNVEFNLNKKEAEEAEEYLQQAYKESSQDVYKSSGMNILK